MKGTFLNPYPSTVYSNINDNLGGGVYSCPNSYTNGLANTTGVLYVAGDIKYLVTKETFAFCRKDGSWLRADNFGYNSLAELAGGVASEMGYKRVKIKIETGGVYVIPERYGLATLTLPYYSQFAVVFFKDGNTVVEYSSSTIIGSNGSHLQIEKNGDSVQLKNNSSGSLDVNINIIG